MEIDLHTKIGQLLEAYPELEEELIAINPKYKKLKNPILRRTVARIATLEQVAKVGGMEPVKLVNRIRAILGKPPLQVPVSKLSLEDLQPAPDWAIKEPYAVLDATQLLDEGKNPLEVVNELLRDAKKDDVIRLRADFLPEPLIDTMKKRGLEVYVQEKQGRYSVFIKKS